MMTNALFVSYYQRDALHSAVIAFVADKDIIKLLSRPCSPIITVFNTTYGCEILTGRGACHSGGLRYFPSENA